MAPKKPTATPPFAPINLDTGSQLSTAVAEFGPRSDAPELPIKALQQISDDAGFPARTPSTKSGQAVEPAPRPAKFEVRGRRKRKLTGRNYTFSVRLRPEDAQRIYDLADQMGARTVADVIESAVAALEAKIGRTVGSADDAGGG